LSPNFDAGITVPLAPLAPLDIYIFIAYTSIVIEYISVGEIPIRIWIAAVKGWKHSALV
jgi:hypothetical protein